MIESIKNRIWDMLKEKDVSLAMLYDKEGNILWQRGRKIKGKTIPEGEGFSKSCIEKTLSSDIPVKEEDVVISLSSEHLPHSARVLYIKSLFIQPLAPGYYLYIDSGSKEAFTAGDCEIFKLLGQMLGEMIIRMRSTQENAGGISGTSDAVKKIREQVIKYALEEEPVLLLGETGVGKNHVAELIHRFSGRQGKFVVVNTPSIPETLFESELFGHKKGAFTGAGENKNGLVQEADKGTLFFDEIAEIPFSFQAKLLQLIDVKKYRWLGDARERYADLRIVAASNRDLEEEVKQNRFRKDLFFRLNVLPIEIPPLRERKEDIAVIVNEYQSLLKGKTVTQGFWKVLNRYDWPGNVRELINLLKRAGIHLVNPVIDREIETLLKRTKVEDPVYPGFNGEQFEKEIAGGKNFWDSIWKAFINREISRREVLSLLGKYFRQNQRNLKAMARSLNIPEKDYPRFISALHKYGVHPGKSEKEF